MSRSLTTAIKNELATNDIRPFHLLTISFSTPVNFTDCSFSLTSSISGSSVTYNPSDFVIGIGDFQEEIDITKSSLLISLSGADQTFISTVLNENITNDEVTIFRGLLDTNNSNSILSDKNLPHVKSFKNLRVIMLQLVDRLKVANNVQLPLNFWNFYHQRLFLFKWM